MALPVTLRVPANGALSEAKFCGAHGIPALALEEVVPGSGFPADVTALGTCGAPILAVFAPRPAARGGVGSLCHHDVAVRDAAFRLVMETMVLLRGLKCSTVIVTVGSRSTSSGVGERKDQIALELCRRLYPLCTASDALRLLLLPADGPTSFLDPETFGWMRGELPRIGLALDYGESIKGEAEGGPRFERWMSDHDAALGFVGVSDHDGGGHVVLPGCGVSDFARLKDALGRSRPRAIRPPVGSTLDDILASAEEADKRFDLRGDVDSWRA